VGETMAGETLLLSPAALSAAEALRRRVSGPLSVGRLLELLPVTTFQSRRRSMNTLFMNGPAVEISSKTL
jgi:hypothetical protein